MTTFGSVEMHLGKDSMGWLQVVSDCFEEIMLHCDQEGTSYPSVGRVKQNDGLLRIHLGGVTEEPSVNGGEKSCHWAE